jgi:hypothetical protein
MHNERFRRMTTIAGTMLCLIAATSNGQDTSVTTPPTTGPGATTGTAGGPPFDTTTMAAPMGMTDTLATADTRDGFDFPWGLLGLLGLLGLMKRGGGTTVVTRENYTSPPSGTRPGVNRGAAGTDDRTMNLNPRPGEGTDPNARR